MKTLVLGFLALTLFVLPGQAQTSITVTNFSFETPTVPASPGYTIVASGSSSGVIDAWTFADSLSSGSVGGLQKTPALSGMNGSQYAFFNVLPGKGYSTITYTTSGDSAGNGASLGNIQSNYDYVLTVALGDSGPNGVYVPGDFDLNLQANGVTVATTSVTSGVTYGSLSDFNVTLDAKMIAADGIAGESLGIQLVAASDPSGTSYNQDDFDNVRLTEQAVPEPSSYAMIGLGLAVMLGIRRFRKAGSLS